MTRSECEKEGPAIAVLLHNIRSAHNVGAIFRTADAIGVCQIVLSGYTPTPLDRFQRPVKEIAKTALGAELSIPWEYEKDPQVVIRRYKAMGYQVVGVEQDVRAVDYKTHHLTLPTLFLVGNEVRGLSRALCDACDVLLEIPMRGKKESLNVAVSFGIALFRVCDR